MLLELAETTKGKIVIDSTNPLNADWSPKLLGQENSAAEEISRLLLEAYAADQGGGTHAAFVYLQKESA